MKKYITNTSYFTLILSAALGAGSAYTHADETEVNIDLSVQLFLGNVSELHRDKFFNMHDSHTNNKYSSAEVNYMQEILNAGYGRGFYSPLSVQGNGPYPSESESMEKGAAEIALRKRSRLYPYISKRFIVTDHPRNVYQPDRDPVAGATWAADYFQYYYDEESRPLFYEPMNEPFVHAADYVEGPWNPEENKRHRDGMTAWFREIGREFDERELNVNIIGYSSAWPSLELWDFGHWDAYMKAFMDDAGEHMDAFSTHLYDGVNVTGQANLRSGSNTSAILDLIETYSNIKWEITKPHAITEYGGIIQRPPGENFYDPAINSQELRSYNHILFSLLKRQDRVLTSTPFISGKSPWYYNNNNFHPYSADMWRPDPDKIVGTKINGFLLTEKVKFFQLWSEVRGNRASIKTDDPDLNVEAFVHGPHAFIALNNLEDTSKKVKLDFLDDYDDLINVRIKRLNVPAGEVAIYTDETIEESPESLTMAAAETVILQYTFTSPIEQYNAIQNITYYSDAHLKTIVADEALTFSFDNIHLNKGPRSYLYNSIKGGFEFDHEFYANYHNKNSSLFTVGFFEKNIIKYVLHKIFNQWGYNDSHGYTTLRMSLGRKHDKSKQPDIFVNGHKMTVPNDWAGYDQANRDEFFGSIEIPVPIKYLKPETRVDIVFPDSEGRVSSLVLDVEKYEEQNTIAVEGIEISSSVLKMNKDNNRRLKANVFPNNATDKYVLWTSSDPSVASISSSGLITPLQAGEVTITAQSYDGGFIATSNVTVLDQVTIPDLVTITEDLSDEVSSTHYSIEVTYSAASERDINLGLRATGNRWLGDTTITVPAGEGVINIDLTFDEPIAADSGYQFIAGIRTVGGTWRDNFDGHTSAKVDIVEGGSTL